MFIDMLKLGLSLLEQMEPNPYSIGVPSHSAGFVSTCADFYVSHAATPVLQVSSGLQHYTTASASRLVVLDASALLVTG